jgi:hypothetical protein
VTSRAAFLAWHPTLLAVAVAEPDRAPDVRAVVESFNSGWRSEAACQGEESLFLSDVNLGFPKHAGSTVVTLALLICAGCPVRRECLVEALTEIAFDLDPGSHDSNRPKTTIHVDGVWGRTTTVDRRSVSGLSRGHSPPGCSVMRWPSVGRCWPMPTPTDRGRGSVAS